MQVLKPGFFREVVVEELRDFEALLRGDVPIRRGDADGEVHEIQLQGVLKVMVGALAGVAHVGACFVEKAVQVLMDVGPGHGEGRKGLCGGFDVGELALQVAHGAELLLAVGDVELAAGVYGEPELLAVDAQENADA